MEVPIDLTKWNDEVTDLYGEIQGDRIQKNWVTKLIAFSFVLIVGFPWAYMLTLWFATSNAIALAACAAVGVGLGIFMANFLDNMVRSAILSTFTLAQVQLFIRDKGLEEDFTKNVAKYRL